MARKPQTPFDKIMTVRSKLDLYIRFGDSALGGQSEKEFLVEVHEALELLMEFRNIINSMVSLEEAPLMAVLPYLSDDVVKSLHDA